MPHAWTLTRGLLTVFPAFLLCSFTAFPQTNVYVDFVYPGTEAGTPGQPFDTLGEALGLVNPGGTIHIDANSSHEIPTINQAVTLRTTGGAVRLGVLSSVLGSGAPLKWLRITEIMYNPGDGGAEYLELQNTGPAALDVSGVFFSDGIDFTFPASTMLSSGEYIVLVRSTDLAAFSSNYPLVTIGGVYTGALDNGGETLTLSSPSTIPFLSITYNDAGGWPGAADGFGFSLVIRNPQNDPNDPNNWRGSGEDGGSPGAVDLDPNNPLVVINEALTHTDLPAVDTIEIFNPTGSTADIRGWFISDNPNNPLKAKIPNEAQYNIAPGDYAVLDETDFAPSPDGNPGSVGATPLPGFRMSAFGEGAYLFSAENDVLTGYVHGFNFDAAENGVSFGRQVTSDGREHFTAQLSQTFGSANSGPVVGDLVISEVHYNPVPGGVEYLKITNRSGGTVNLFDDTGGGDPNNTHKIKGIGFVFPPGQSIGPGASVLVVNMPPPHYVARFGNPGLPVYGPFGNYDGADAFGLSNGSERLKVQWADHAGVNPETSQVEVPYVAMDDVRYDDDAPWPNADNNFLSITRNTLSTYGSEPTNWTAVGTTAQANGGATNPVTFTLQRGFYSSTQSLGMSTATSGSAIWYTTDGSFPAPGFGTSTQYTAPVSISSNAAVRAVAYKGGSLPSVVTSATYIIGAPANETAINALAVIGDPQQDLFHPNGIMAINGGTYVRSTFNTFHWEPRFPNVGGGLQDFADGSNGSQNIAGVQSINDAIGNPIYVPGGAIDPAAYNNPVLGGRFMERPSSFEMLDPVTPANGMQANAGIRVHGSTFHRPRYAMHPDGSGDWTQPFDIPYGGISDASLASYLKFSLRMYFRGDYGPTKLTWPIFPGDPLLPDYDKVVLRGGHNDGYNPFMKDELTRRLYIDMGRVSARGEMYNLYINGVYRGYYNATERHDDDFLSLRFNTSKDWDLLTHPLDVAFDPNNPQISEGDKVSWNALMAAVAAQQSSPSQSNFDAIAALLDIDAFIDYLLVQLYSGNDDWPNNNWGAAHERVPGAKWVFLVWDAEATYNSGNINKTGLNFFPFWWGGGTGLKGMDTSIAHIYRACALNAGFRSTFQTRAQAHLGPGGALDTVNVTNRFNELAATMTSVMPAGETFNDYIGTDWIPNREAVLIGDLQAEGLYP